MFHKLKLLSFHPIYFRFNAHGREEKITRNATRSSRRQLLNMYKSRELDAIMA